MSILVSIVDDDASERESLAQLINNAPGYHCISRHASADDALLDLPPRCPDVGLIAVNVPGTTGADFVRRLRPVQPDMQVILLTACLDLSTILDALSEGAAGCLLKPTPPWELLYAIRDVHHGGSPINSRITRKIVESFRKSPRNNGAVGNLSHRQSQVLDLLAQGHSYKQIARMMQLSYATVHTHIRWIYKKLEVNSRFQAIAKRPGHDRHLFPGVFPAANQVLSPAQMRSE